jgi:hypothetical protein
MDGQYRTHVFSVLKVDNSKDFQDDGIINYRIHHNSLCRDKNKHYVVSYVMVYKAMDHHVTLPCMRNISFAPTLLAQK